MSKPRLSKGWRMPVHCWYGDRVTRVVLMLTCCLASVSGCSDEEGAPRPPRPDAGAQIDAAGDADALAQDGSLVRDAMRPDANLDASVEDASLVIPDGAMECMGALQCPKGEPTCSDGTLTTHDRVCADGACGLAIKQTACPTNAGFCRGLEYVTFTPTCADESKCGASTENAQTCSAPGASCSDGKLTEHSPVCVSETGCEVDSRSTDCPTEDSYCTNAAEPELVVSVPTCQDGSRCGTPSESRTSCTAPPSSCNGTVWTKQTPTCNPVQESCGVKTTTTDCAKQNICNSEPLSDQVGCRMNITTGTCDTTEGCVTSQRQVNCPGKKCDCGTQTCV